MFVNVTALDQISHVISQAIAPAFLLGAVAAFVSVLITRMNRIVDRSNVLIDISDDDSARAPLKAILPRLKWRVRLLHKAIEYAVIGGIFTILLVIFAFASAYLNFRHEWMTGILFILALCFLAAALFTLWREIRAALKDDDYHI